MACWAGCGSSPAARVKEGEDLPACLRREIREELGAEVSVGEALGVYRHAYTHFRITLHAFRCRLLSGEPHPLQAADLRWVPRRICISSPWARSTARSPRAYGKHAAEFFSPIPPTVRKNGAPYAPSRWEGGIFAKNGLRGGA